MINFVRAVHGSLRIIDLYRFQKIRNNMFPAVVECAMTSFWCRRADAVDAEVINKKLISR